MLRSNHPAVFPALAAILALPSPLPAAETLDCTILPIQLPKRELDDQLDARNYKIPPRVAPADALGYDYNFLGLQRSSIHSETKLKPGKATVRFEFQYTGGGPGKGGKGSLFLNDEKVAEGDIAHTRGMIVSADETADVGIDLGTPVVETVGSGEKSKFSGRIPKLVVEVKP